MAFCFSKFTQLTRVFINSLTRFSIALNINNWHKLLNVVENWILATSQTSSFISLRISWGKGPCLVKLSLRRLPLMEGHQVLNPWPCLNPSITASLHPFDRERGTHTGQSGLQKKTYMWWQVKQFTLYSWLWSSLCDLGTFLQIILNESHLTCSHL